MSGIACTPQKTGHRDPYLPFTVGSWRPAPKPSLGDQDPALLTCRAVPPGGGVRNPPVSVKPQELPCSPRTCTSQRALGRRWRREEREGACRALGPSFTSIPSSHPGLEGASARMRTLGQQEAAKGEDVEGGGGRSTQLAR